MGIESDQLVYDYLSRVGDAAQQQQLPSGDRMRLVSTLRNEIDRQRGKFGGDSPAAVRRILGRMGEPNAVVRAASHGVPTGSAAVLPEPVVPEQRTRRGVLRRSKDGGAGAGAGGGGARAGAGAGAGASGAEVPRQPSPPHLAGMDELGPPGGGPDWWRIAPGPMAGGGEGGGRGVPGFVGGVEIPEILVPPPEDKDEEGDEDGAGVEAGVVAKTGGPFARRWGKLLRRGGAVEAEKPDVAVKAKKAGRVGGRSHPMLLLAALLLVVGAGLSSWLALAGGWLLAYASRTLSRTAAKWAVFGIPGISIAGGLIWLWGRSEGRWGEVIPKGGMNDALSGVGPVVIRTAAIASALYLLWRSRRR